MSRLSRVILCCVILQASSIQAEVIKKKSDHFVLRHEAVSSLSSEQLWSRLIQPKSWWSSAHTYSGDANNLSLDLRPGGLWQERWENGEVLHGTVLSYTLGEQLRLDAPFGPLQAMAVKSIWTITVTPEGEGSRVVFDVVVNGSRSSKLQSMAKAVDYVKTEAINNLVSVDAN